MRNRKLMGLVEARRLCDELIAHYGLLDWRTVFIDARSKLGHCSYHKKEIALSRSFVKYNTKLRVKQTILHEIAHALVGSQVRSHGREWKEKAYEIGVRGWAVASVAAHRAVEVRRVKKAAVDVQEVRYNQTLEGIKRWETKLKRATNALKKLQARKRYYERALAAKGD